MKFLRQDNWYRGMSGTVVSLIRVACMSQVLLLEPTCSAFVLLLLLLSLVSPVCGVSTLIFLRQTMFHCVATILM